MISSCSSGSSSTLIPGRSGPNEFDFIARKVPAEVRQAVSDTHQPRAQVADRLFTAQKGSA